MSYNQIPVDNSRFSHCQIDAMEYELYDPAGSRGHVLHQCSLMGFVLCPNNVKLSWTVDTGNVVISRNGQVIATEPASVGSYTDVAPPGDHTYTVETNCVTHEYRATILGNVPDHVIWRAADPGPSSHYDSAAELEAALLANGQDVLVVDNLPAVYCLDPSTTIWAMMGTYPNARALTDAEGGGLYYHVNAGGSVYIEGADVWAYDPPTLFANTDGVEDGAGVDGAIITTIVGQQYRSADFSGLVSSYYLPSVDADHIDFLVPATTDRHGPYSGVIWAGTAGSTVVGTFNDQPAEFGKVICQTFEFGGYVLDPVDLARRYVDLLVGVPATKQFRVTGSSSGVGFSFGFGGEVKTRHDVAALPVGAPASTFASEIVATINTLSSSRGVTAAVDSSDPTIFSITCSRGDFEFWIEGPIGTDCEVTNNPSGCSFNPLIEEVVPQSVKRGDTNGDGTVNIADAVYLLGHLFPATGQVPNHLDCEAAADANGDKLLNLLDPLAIIGSLFGEPIVPLAEPAEVTDCNLAP